MILNELMTNNSENQIIQNELMNDKLKESNNIIVHVHQPQGKGNT